MSGKNDLQEPRESECSGKVQQIVRKQDDWPQMSRSVVFNSWALRLSRQRRTLHPPSPGSK